MSGRIWSDIQQISFLTVWVVLFVLLLFVDMEPEYIRSGLLVGCLVQMVWAIPGVWRAAKHAFGPPGEVPNG